MGRCVLRVLVTFSRLLPSASRASRALQGPGRRCTSTARRANPCKTAPFRVVVQELEQDDDKVVTPRPDPPHCGHEQNKKRAAWQKKKERRLFEGIFPAREFFVLHFDINSEKINAGWNYSHYSFIFFENNKSAPRQICNYFCKDGTWCSSEVSVKWKS